MPVARPVSLLPWWFRFSAAGLLAFLIAGPAALTARADTTEIYQDGRLHAANIRQLSGNPGHGEDLPDLYLRALACEWSADSTVILCYETSNPPVLGEEVNPPHYQAVDIFFMPGMDPRVFTSVSEIEQAAEAEEVLLAPSEDVFLCKLIGPQGGGAAPSGRADVPIVNQTRWGLLRALYR